MLQGLLIGLLSVVMADLVIEKPVPDKIEFYESKGKASVQKRMIIGSDRSIVLQMTKIRGNGQILSAILSKKDYDQLLLLLNALDTSVLNGHYLNPKGASCQGGQSIWLFYPGDNFFMTSGTYKAPKELLALHGFLYSIMKKMEKGKLLKD